MKYTTNHNINMPGYNNVADIAVIGDSFEQIDKGLVMDVGASSGSINNYVIDIGGIVLGPENKGATYKFWADRDSTGAVTINNAYNLLDSNKKPVKKLKEGIPYIISFDGDKNFFLGSGSNIDYASTTVTGDGSKVLEGEKYIGNDGEEHEGTMKNHGIVTVNLPLNGAYNIEEGFYKAGSKVTQNVTTQGAYTNAVNNSADSNYLYSRIPTGAYFTKSSNGYPEIRNSLSSVADAIKKLPDDTKSDVIHSIGASTCIRGNFTKGLYDTQTEITLGFKPDLVIIAVKDTTFKDMYMYMSTNSPWGIEDNRYWAAYSSSTAGGDGYISTNDTGFIFSKKFNSSSTCNYIAVRF